MYGATPTCGRGYPITSAGAVRPEYGTDSAPTNSGLEDSPMAKRLGRRRTRIAITMAVVATAVLGVVAPQSSTATSAGNAPGAAIPAAMAGWRLKFSDNFTGGRLNTAAWSVFRNRHGHRGPKLASNIVLHNGIMTLK